jgi:hypothetical protein
MDTQASVHERLNALIEYFAKGNKTAFSKEVGTLPSVVASIVGGRMSKPSFELLEKIMLRYPEINGSWLLAGRGPMIIPAPPARVQLPYKPPTQPRPGQFLPSNATDHLEEFYKQQSADWHYLIEVGKYLEAVSPSALMQDFTSRLPYTLNPSYDPDEVEQDHDERDNPTA